MVPWKKMADFPQSLNEEVVLTNGKDITRVNTTARRRLGLMLQP